MPRFVEKALEGNKSSKEEAAAAPSSQRKGLFGIKKGKRDDFYESVVYKKSKWFVFSQHIYFCLVIQNSPTTKIWLGLAVGTKGSFASTRTGGLRIVKTFSSYLVDQTTHNTHLTAGSNTGKETWLKDRPSTPFFRNRQNIYYSPL